MPLPPGVRRVFQLALPGRHSSVAGAVDEEIAFHLEMRTRELRARGVAPEAARAEAERRFGDRDHWSHVMTELDRSQLTRVHRADRLRAIARDLGFTLRALRRQPLFTAGVVATLALGIGANATMFGIVDRLLLRPPAHVADPGELRRLYSARVAPTGGENTSSSFSYAEFAALRDDARSFGGVGAWSSMDLPLGRGLEARQVKAAAASASLWTTLGVHAALGRLYGAAEDQPPNGTRVVVLGHDLWRNSFGADPSVLGRMLHIGSADYQVIGVMPQGFSGPDVERVDLWLPATAIGSTVLGAFTGDDPWWRVRNVGWLRLAARLAPGVSEAQVGAELGVLYPRTLTTALRPMTEERVAREKPRIVLAPIQAERGPQRSAATRVVTWLFGVAAFVLVIACANVANLLLARATRRRRELAVRMALGVGRSRLVTQLLLESVLLALAGGAAGLLLASWGGGLVRAFVLPDVAWGAAIADRRVLLFTMGAALLTGVVAGLVPAIQASRPDLTTALRAGAREGGGRRSRTRISLLVLQAAVSTVLLIGAGLFVRSLQHVVATDFGFEPDRVLQLEADPQAAGYAAEEIPPLYDRLLARVQQLPGVASAAISVTVPFQTNWDVEITLPGGDSVPAMPSGRPLYTAVSGDYFRTMGTRIIAGRPLGDQDRVGAAQTVVVSRTTARVLWPGERAVGKCVYIGKPDSVPCREVVGVAEDVHWSGVRAEPRMMLYAPLAQAGFELPLRALLVRPAGDPAATSRAVQQALLDEAPRVGFARAVLLQESVDPELRPWRLGAGVFTAFGLLALVIAAVGLYSVLAYLVAQRTHEMGVRVALGASRGDVLRLILGEGLRVTAVGVALGLLAALAVGRLLGGMLVDVSARDPLVLGGVSAVLLVVAGLASAVPAWRATRVDPGSALRVD